METARGTAREELALLMEELETELRPHEMLEAIALANRISRLIRESAVGIPALGIVAAQVEVALEDLEGMM